MHQHQRPHQQQQPNNPRAAAVAGADGPRRPFVGVLGMLTAMVVLLFAIFAEFRFSLVSTFRSDSIMSGTCMGAEGAGTLLYIVPHTSY